jgi:hypothetical protein
MVTQLSFHNLTVLLGLIAATIYRYKSDTLLPERLKALGTSR